MSPPPRRPLPSAEFDRLVARLRAAGCVFAEDEAALLVEVARDPADLAAMVAQRVAGLPLEPILGFAEFCGLRILVDPGVFVPRQRTRLLVREAAAAARGAGRAAVVVDLCCGSGAVAVAVASMVEGLELHAADIEPAAVACARRNVQPLGGSVWEGDLFEALPAGLRGRVDVLVANAPYVPTQAVGLMPPEARLYEPLVALDGGADGLDVQRRVVGGVDGWLAPGGHVLIESSEEQAAGTALAFERAGLAPRIVVSEGWEACVVIGVRE